MSKVCCVLYIKSPFKKLNLSNQNKHKLSVVTEKISTDPLEENLLIQIINRMAKFG